MSRRKQTTPNKVHCLSYLGSASLRLRSGPKRTEAALHPMEIILQHYLESSTGGASLRRAGGASPPGHDEK
ncbi:unnamed protein product [Eretmochelys imbricata]